MKDTVKIIALDLDDTLLRNDLTISDYTVSILRTVMQKGMLVILASGRSPRAMYPYAQRIGSSKTESFMICSNGSQILTADMQTKVAEYYLGTALALDIFDCVEEHNLSCHLYADDTIYAAKQTIFSDRDSHLTKMKLIIPKDYRHVLQTQPVYKLVIPAMPETITAVEPAFRSRFENRAVLFTSKPYFLEFIPLNTGKGEALQQLAQRLGFDKNAILAFGDSMNDETMIRSAGYGIAMKNGLPAIQAIAYATTNFTNDEDGVARFLEKHIL